MSARPNAEMAAVAWVKAIPGVDATKVATTVPGDAAGWAATGFVTVTSVGGSPAIHTQLRHPVLSISAWAVTPNSQRTPWGQAQALAERVFNAFYDPDRFPYLAAFGSLDFLAARIATAYPLSEPVKIPGSDANYAQVQFDATFTWVVVA